MELNVKYSDKEVESLGVKKSTNFGFSDEAQEIIFGMFTKNIYSNPIGSVVREITSNCFDSHKEAKVTDAVVLKLTKENNEYYISFIDVGVGMSPERMTDVYALYFNSTKRNDNNQIGGFGIGGKTPLAYTESFFLTTNFDGIKYVYSIRKGEKSPVLDLLQQKKTTDRNGTTIKIPVRPNDVYIFEREINRQLYYFENVIFEGFSDTVKNSFRIIEGKNFFYRGSSFNSYVHICLGRVAYPIDFNTLNDDNSEKFYAGNWDVPVAIKMEIGEINVGASRENIEYNDETKKLIKKRLLALKAEMVTMIDKQHEKVETLEEYYKMVNEPNNLFVSKEETVNISSFRDNRNPVRFKKLNALDIPSQLEVVHQFYHVSKLGKCGRREHTWDNSIKNIGNEHVYLVKDGDEMPRKKGTYMKHLFKHYYNIKRTKLRVSDVKFLIGKFTPDNSKTDRKIIFQQFRMLRDEIYSLVEKKVKLYSSIVVPENFKLNYGGKTYDPSYELPVTYNSKYGFTKERLKMADLAKTKATLYYGDLTDESMLISLKDMYEALFSPKDENQFRLGYSDYQGFPVRFIMVSKGNMKHISALKNAKPYSEFEKLLSRKRDAVAKQVEKEFFFERLREQNDLFLNENLFKAIDKDYYKKVKALNALSDAYNYVTSFRISTAPNSHLMNLLKLDPTTINYKGHELFAAVEKTGEKNGMLSFVRISKDFNPTDKDSKYSKKEISDILKLLKLAYVK